MCGTALTAFPAAAGPAVPAPKGLTVQRDSKDLHTLLINWKPVPGIANYMVRVNDGAKDTNLIIPADTTSATFEGAGDCTNYKVAVSAVISKDVMGTTGATFVPSLGPGGITAARGTRNDSGRIGTVTWEAPKRPGAGSLKGYDVVVKQLSTGRILHNETQQDTRLSLPDLNPNRMYSVKVTPVNEFGGCVTSNILLGNERPASPEFTVTRSPSQPADAVVSWKGVQWSGYGRLDGYTIGYKSIKDKGYTWIGARPGDRSKTVPNLDPTINWTFVMRADNGDLKGLLSKPYTLMRSGYEPVNATVDIKGGADAITVDFSAPVGSSTNYPIARIDIAKANGTKGWSDRHSVTNMAGRATFNPVPCGTYEVVVTGIGTTRSKEMVRTTSRVCDIPPVCFTSTLQNGNFESPAIPNASFRILSTSTPGLAWNNTAEPNIELWSTGFSSSSNGKVTAPEGRQFAELNANKAGTLYQDLPTTPGTTMRWHLKHRGRAGTDTMRVMVGNPQGKLTQSGSDITTGNTAWVQYTDTYKVPAGQTTTRFAFQAVKTATGSPSVGNFLDDIVFTPEACQ